MDSNKSHLKLALFLFICLLCFSACSSIKKPFLWRLEKDGRTSYALGTIHAGIDIRELPNFVTRKIEEANLVLLETDLGYYKSGFRPVEQQSKISKLLQTEKQLAENLKKKKSIKPLFNDKEWKIIIDRSMESKVSPDTVEYYPLSALAILVFRNNPTYVNFKQHSVIRAKSLDRSIERRAINAEIPVLQLDTPERMSPECWDKFYLYSIKRNLELTTYDRIEDLVSLSDAYKNGDEQALLKENEKTDLSLKECLLKNRNKHWVEQIDKYHTSKSPIFVAGGVAHFIDEFNILISLEKLGYKITRITDGD